MHHMIVLAASKAVGAIEAPGVGGSGGGGGVAVEVVVVVVVDVVEAV